MWRAAQVWDSCANCSIYGKFAMGDEWQGKGIQKEEVMLFIAVDAAATLDSGRSHSTNKMTAGFFKNMSGAWPAVRMLL